jgi:hypothetical protein
MRATFLWLIPLAGCARMGSPQSSADATTDGSTDGSTDAAADGAQTIDGAPVIGPTDAIAHFKLDQSLADLVTGNVATCTGAECPTFVTGASGDAASFNGTTTCVHAPWLTSWMPDRFTMSAWVRTNNATNGPVVIHDFATACPAPAMVMADGSVGMVVLDTKPGTTNGDHEQAWVPAHTIPLATWQHVAVRWDGTRQEVYVGGVCDCSITPTIPFQVKQNELDLGCYPSAGTFFSGAIDEVQLFARALTPDEISQLATIDGRSAPTPVSCAATCGGIPPQ